MRADTTGAIPNVIRAIEIEALAERVLDNGARQNLLRLAQYYRDQADEVLHPATSGHGVGDRIT